MRVIGIDPSLSGTGLYFCEDFEQTSSLLIDTVKKVKKEKDEQKKSKAKKMSTEEIMERLQREEYIYDKVLKYLQMTKPDYIAVEGYSFMGTNLAIQAEVVGVIGIAIQHYRKINKQCQVMFFTPQSLKKFITGKGSGHKELVLKEVYKKYNLDVDNNNIADAFVLAQMGSEFAYMFEKKRFRKELKSYQLDIYKNLFFSKDLIKEIQGRKKNA